MSVPRKRSDGAARFFAQLARHPVPLFETVTVGGTGGIAMLPRVIGSGLGFLAFSTTILLGLWVGNPTSVTLTRSICAMFIFSIIGLAVGWAAEVVVREHENHQLKSLLAENQAKPTPGGEDKAKNASTEDDSKPMGT